jgi:filamentous hemagglutinin family protein
MNKNKFILLKYCTKISICTFQFIFIWLFMFADLALSQIIPDNTLSNDSLIDNSQEGISKITGGTKAGNNLFHSFSQFSVNNGTTAHFDNAVTIANIFSRVTGNSISNIDGIIKANGNANFFLLNPNGIIFTKNARLNIGGSFIGSTADSIKFNDNREFSATNLQSKPLLSVNLPTALQFTSNPNPITIQGTGHDLSLDANTGAVLNIIAEGLEVPIGKTLALIGGNINLEGGNLKAEAGTIELGSIQSEGAVSITPQNLGWTFGYENVTNFSEINLQQGASINTTGESGGDVKLQGQNIYFRDGSYLLTNTEGSGNAGDVNIYATEKFELRGTSPQESRLPSSIVSETNGGGNGGNIIVNSNQLVLKDGAQFSSNSFSTGNAGNITINSDNVELIGYNPFDQRLASGFVSQARNLGDAGEIRINSDNVIIRERAQIAVTSFSPGNGGNIIINTKSISISSDPSEVSNPGGLFNNAQGPGGNAGNIFVNAENIKVDQGGNITSATFFSGKGGNITLNASESITIANSLENATSGIFAAAVSPPPFVGVVGTGDGGNINITTSQLNITNGAQVNVSNFDRRGFFPPGVGIPGNISIKADSLNIDNAQITARANLKNGGNINLNVGNISTLSNQGIISATAGVAEEFGNGGNINFNSQFIIASGVSEITAEAFKGTGGNINLSAEGLFFTPDMIISASSQLGADGIVEIIIPNTTPIGGLIERQNFEYPEQIAVGCSEDGGITEGSLTYTGKGGVPELSTDEFSADTFIDDLRPLPSNTEKTRTTRIPPTKPVPKIIREAQGWQWKDSNKNTVVLTGKPVEINPQSSFSGEGKVNCRSSIR